MYEERSDCPFSAIYGHVLFFGTAEKFKKLCLSFLHYWLNIIRGTG